MGTQKRFPSKLINPRSETNAQAASDASPTTSRSFNFEQNRQQQFPSQQPDSERKVVFRGGKIDSETYYRTGADAHHPEYRKTLQERTDYHRNDRTQNFVRRNASPDTDHRSILRDRNRTPTGFIRKQPPMTPPGYTRITDAPNVGKIRPDSNPSTPASFVQTKPEYITFDKNVKPQTQEGQNQSQMTPRTIISTIVEKFSDKFAIQPKSAESSADKRQSSDYRKGREQSNSSSKKFNQNNRRGRSDSFDRRNFKRNNNRGRSNSLDRKRPQRYNTPTRETNRTPADSYPRDYTR